MYKRQLQHPYQKKIWGQIVTELVSQRNLKVALACRLFDHCRPAYYQSKADIELSLIHIYAQQAKYVFYFIGDGMGVNQVNGTEM